jgi:hypothetical protein
MAEPAGQQNTTSLSWRVRVCRASWKGLLFVWGTVVIGMSVGTVANLNTTTIRKTGETGTSLTAILSKLFIVLQKRQKTAPTSGSIPGAPHAGQADEIAKPTSATLPSHKCLPNEAHLAWVSVPQNEILLGVQPLPQCAKRLDVLLPKKFR